LSRSGEDTFKWDNHQAYIALGFWIAAVAIEQIDSVPIEGFNPATLDELFQLE